MTPPSPALHRAFPAAWFDVPGELVADMDNTPDDRHVLATAVAHVVVTATTDEHHEL